MRPLRSMLPACCLVAVLAGCGHGGGGGGGFDRQGAMAACEQRRAAAPTPGPDDCPRQVDAQAQEAAALAGVGGVDNGGGRNQGRVAPTGRHGGGLGTGGGFGRGAGFGTPGAPDASPNGGLP